MEIDGDLFDRQTAARTAVRLRFSGGSVAVADAAPAAYRVAEAERDGYTRLLLEDGRVVVFTNRDVQLALLGKARSWSAIPPGRKVVYLVIALAVIVPLLFRYGLDAAVELGVLLVPPALEEKMGAAVFEQVLAMHEAAGPATEAVFAKVPARLAAPDGRPMRLRVRLLENADVANAFAFPGTNVAVFRGLLTAVKGEEELLAVLAHEAGHVHHRHAIRQLIRAFTVGFFTSVLLGDITGMSAVFLDSGSQLLQLSYSREEELQADAYAADVLRRLGIEPKALGSALDRITAGELPHWVAMFSTHPSNAERKALLASAGAPTGAAYRPVLTPAEWEQLAYAPDATACTCEEE